MTNLLLPLWMIICLLFPFPSMANEARLQHLISQAEAAIAHNDDEERSRIVDEIFELTTGLDAQLESLPESLSVEDFERRLCIYYKAIAPLHTREGLELLRHEARFYAHKLIIYGMTEFEAVRIRLECVQDNGNPVPEAKALHEGLAWAKRLDASDIAEAQAMAREYEALIKRHPDDKMYQGFNLMMGSLVDRKRSDRDLEKSKQRLDVTTYRWTLAERADKGDVAVQLEVARRLETGDKFEQNTLFAYYWYKRAQQNNGGEAAQQGLDRLLPQLKKSIVYGSRAGLKINFACIDTAIFERPCSSPYMLGIDGRIPPHLM